MALIEITIQFREQDKRTVQTLELDGARWQFATYTNRADGSWYLDLADSAGTALLFGIALVTGLELLFPYRHLDVPPGALFVNDLAGPREDPGLSTFQDRGAALYYLEATT